MSHSGAVGPVRQRGPIAEDIDQLTWVLTILGTAVFVLVCVLLALAIRRHGTENADPRRLVDAPEDDPADDRHLTHRELRGDGLGATGRAGRRMVLYGGVLLPVVVVGVVLGWTLETMLEVPTEASADALTVDVTAQQWEWSFAYPGGVTDVDGELHIPVDRDVELRMQSIDVVHSLWVPALGGKLDVLPDHVNTLILRADEVGTYLGRCAEFCGLNHAEMEFAVVAHSQDDFEAWLESAEGGTP